MPTIYRLTLQLTSKSVIFSDVPTSRQVLERFVAWAVQVNLIRSLSLSSVEKKPAEALLNRLR